MHPTDRPTRAEFEREVDLVLAGSFPASDPPPWTLGAASPHVDERPRPFRATAPAAVDEVIGSNDWRGIGAVVEAIGLMALLPLGIVIVAAIVAAFARLLGR